MKIDSPIIIGEMTQVTPLAPTASQSFTPKSYVDAVASAAANAELAKESCRVATTENITLSGFQSIDGVTVSLDNRVLVKDQSDPKQNGIYLAKSDAWIRSADADNTPGAEILNGMFVFVRQGTVNGSTAWIMTTENPITLGSSNIVLVQFTGSAQFQFTNGLLQEGTVVGLQSGVVTAGSYNSVDVDTYGRVIQGSQVVTLPGDPANALEAAPKQYVDAAKVYDIGGFRDGTLTDSQMVMGLILPRSINLPQNLTGSYASCGVAPTSSLSLTISKNGTTIGSINFSNGQTTGTFTFDTATSFAAGDSLVIRGPVTADTTFADILVTLSSTFS